MRHVDPLNECSTVIPPALAPAPWPCRPTDAQPRRVRMPLAGAGNTARRPGLGSAAPLVISIALIAVFQL